MTIIQRFVILAALTAVLGLSAVEPVDTDNDEPMLASGCCAVCIMQGSGTEYCDRCFQTQGGC